MNGQKSSIARTVTSAAIAGVIFAGFLALTPRLAAGPQTTEPVDPTSVVADAPDVAQNSISDPSVATPNTGLIDGPHEDPADRGSVDATTTTTQPTTTTTTTTVVPGPEPDGTLTLTMGLVGPQDAGGNVFLEDEGWAEWHFRVENSSDENLWGLYVYLEGYGPVGCEDVYLAPGDATDCRARKRVWSGANTADAWATAWTTERQVGEMITYEYFVQE